MKSKWILILSVVINILFIVFLIIIGLKYIESDFSPFISIEGNSNRLVFHHISAQSNPIDSKPETSDFQWPEGKKMALSFSFDDARISQIDNGIPLFDRYGVKATFYVSIWNLGRRLEDWKKAISNGHEIGNHTCKHPCSVNYGLRKGIFLEGYTISMMSKELYSENEIIKEMLGIVPVSFAYPCGQTFVGRGINTKSYVPLISEMFETGRGWFNEAPNDPAFCDMSQLTGMELDGKSFDQIKTIIDAAKKTGKWLILAGHDINEDGNKTSQLSTIDSICQYASGANNGIWIDNVHNIAAYVKEKRGEAPFVQTPVYESFVNLLYLKLWSKYYVCKMKLKTLHHGKS